MDLTTLIPSRNDLVKYFLEGAGVAAAAFYIPRRKTDLKAVAMIAVTAALTFWVLDKCAPSVGAGSRQGSGFGIGYGLVGGGNCPYSNKQNRTQNEQYGDALSAERTREQSE